MQTLKHAVAPWQANHGYYNMADTPAPARALLRPDSYRRLEQIKNRDDPDDVIISAHPVLTGR